MTWADKRGEYSWPSTKIKDFQIIPEKKNYRKGEPIIVNLGFRVVGGLRESFIPDVWTVAWEENDKLIRLTMNASLSLVRGRVLASRIASIGKTVRKAKFYWSRDPDLPYRIWSAIIHEDGSAPIIPTSVEDAKAKFLDITKRLEVPARALGKGKHTIVGSAKVSWGRRIYIEKGTASGKSKGVEVAVD